jgi:asparagine synthase (glutamine-hydrolysing)
MSGFFGVFNRNGKAVEKKVVQSLLEASSYWRPDESGTWTEGPVAFGHTMLWNTPESKYEHLPLNNDLIVLTMDARIDNREALAGEIELPDRPLSEIGDSEFIAGAYARWGVECPKHLLGDFAFALWDKRRQRLFCARDHVGVKQFYYHLSDDLFLFGNDLRSLVAYPDLSQKISKKAVANYLANHQLLSNTLTFFEAFEKLPPAHTLTISSSGSDLKSYWGLEDVPRVTFTDAREASEKLRVLIEEAVRARLRSDFPIASHLSGGLDSSSIAAVTAKELAGTGKKLIAFNWLHKPQTPRESSDIEWMNSARVAQMYGIEHSYVPLTREGMLEAMKARDIAFGETAPFWYEYPVREAVQSRGCRTVLSGWGGDELASYHGRSFFCEMFLKGKWLTLFKEYQAMTAGKKNPLRFILGHSYFKIAVPLLPARLQCKLPKLRCLENDPEFANRSSFNRHELFEEKSKLSLYPGRTVRADMLAHWKNSYLQSRIESWASASLQNRLEYSYPLLDKRIIELALNIPARFYRQNGKGRYLFTKAIETLLPPEVSAVQKIREPLRVERLATLMAEALWNLHNEHALKSTNHFVDSQRLIAEIERKNEVFDTMESLLTLQAMESAGSLLLSEKINQDVARPSPLSAPGKNPLFVPFTESLFNFGSFHGFLVSFFILLSICYILYNFVR